MPNTELTPPLIKEEIDDILGGTVLDIELLDEHYVKATKDAIRIYNRNLPRQNWCRLNVAASQQRYLVAPTIAGNTISPPALQGVVDVDFVGTGIQFGASTEFGPPFSNVSPTGLGIAGSTFGEVNNAFSYAKQSQQIASSEPEWQMSWEAGVCYLYIYVPTVGTVNCSYLFSWGVTPDNNAVTGMQNIPATDVDWVMNYAAARAKRILARILRKYGGIPNSTGGADPLDGDPLMEEAKEVEERLLEEIKVRRRPLPPVVG
jgi:hypothetical protein